MLEVDILLDILPYFVFQNVSHLEAGLCVCVWGGGMGGG